MIGKHFSEKQVAAFIKWCFVTTVFMTPSIALFIFWAIFFHIGPEYSGAAYVCAELGVVLFIAAIAASGISFCMIIAGSEGI